MFGRKQVVDDGPGIYPIHLWYFDKTPKALGFLVFTMVQLAKGTEYLTMHSSTAYHGLLDFLKEWLVALDLYSSQN
jgi:hypothetical protein